jgi:predicted XRE-type DNA-binding protein
LQVEIEGPVEPGPRFAFGVGQQGGEIAGVVERCSDVVGGERCGSVVVDVPRVERGLRCGEVALDLAGRLGGELRVRAGTDGGALGQLIYDLRTEAGLSQRELAERMGTTQSVISRLEEGGGARNRIDTLARVATALDRHLVVSFPEKVPAKLKDAVQVA